MNPVLENFGKGAESVLPRTLLGRSILIVVTPVVLLQAILAWVFYESNWNTVTRRLAQSVAGDVAAAISLMPNSLDGEAAASLFTIVRNTLRLSLEFTKGEILPNDPVIVRQNLVDLQLASALTDRVQRPFIIDTRSRPEQVEIHVQLPEGVLHVEIARRRLFSSTTYVFILWMIGTSLVLVTLATFFMRRQVRPIRRLAQAADDFGKGRGGDDFKPAGAAEVELAGRAFLSMQERIRAQIQQRTDMLSGVSHDLRTPLTRMKLQIAMMKAGSESTELANDVQEMEQMVDAYLSFARGEGMEELDDVDMVAMIEEIANVARRQGGDISVNINRMKIEMRIRKNALRRAINNVLSNAQRFARKIEITLLDRSSALEILIDDDGPGIPLAMREEVFKPFFRLETSRNAETGGIGLGLSIARDILRSHGGDIVFADSPLGGVRAILRIPH